MDPEFLSYWNNLTYLSDTATCAIYTLRCETGERRENSKVNWCYYSLALSVLRPYGSETSAKSECGSSMDMIVADRGIEWAAAVDGLPLERVSFLQFWCVLEGIYFVIFLLRRGQVITQQWLWNLDPAIWVPFICGYGSIFHSFIPPKRSTPNSEASCKERFFLLKRISVNFHEFRWWLKTKLKCKPREDHSLLHAQQFQFPAMPSATDAWIAPKAPSVIAPVVPRRPVKNFYFILTFWI